MDIFSESVLEREGARAAAQGRSWRTNPLLHAQNMPQATGEPLSAWSRRHDAWQRGFEGYFQLAPEFELRRKDKLHADLLQTLIERRLQWRPAVQVFMARHPRLVLRLPLPIGHERDQEGRNWNLEDSQRSMTGPAQIDTELHAIVERLRRQYDLLSSPVAASLSNVMASCLSPGGKAPLLATVAKATDAGPLQPGTSAVPMPLQACPALQKAADAPDAGTTEAAAMQERHLRTELGIRRIGWRYEYRGYRYDWLADAVAYARLDRDRQGQRRGPTDDVERLEDEAPSLPGEEDRLLMAQWAIEFEAGHYRLQGYRYDRLSDAVAYARLLASRRSTA
jgi:hypothetical protein